MLSNAELADACYAKTQLPWLRMHTILLVKGGSHAYGLNTPSSDIDVRGIAVPPKHYWLGFAERFEQTVQHEPVDCTIFGLAKYLQLAADANPNILEIVWCDEADIVDLAKPYGEWLIEARNFLLSQKAKYTFSGYAIAQLKRMKTHRRWLLAPPKEKPTRTKFGLPESTTVSADTLGAIEALEKSGTEVTFPPHVMEIYRRERQYTNALREWQQYENWKATRHPARAAIEQRHGYDCKHAMHLVRLMRMAREILTGKGVRVKRTEDREELLAIRNGAWEYDQLIEWAERQDAELAELLPTCGLPHSANRQTLDALCVRIVESMLGLRMAA